MKAGEEKRRAAKDQWTEHPIGKEMGKKEEKKGVCESVMNEEKKKPEQRGRQ